MLRTLAKALLNTAPHALRDRMRKAYVWNVRTDVYGPGVASHNLDTATHAWRTFAFRYGYLRSLQEGACVREDGSPIPWFTYPAIEFLDSLDFTGRRVFEYGAGNSTRYWASRGARVDAVEVEPGWHAQLVGSLPADCTVALETDMARYVAAIERRGVLYDVVVVDGQNQEGTRRRCASAAVSALKPGGMVILDDAGNLPRSCTVLREAGLIEVPMSGFSPLNAYPNTTAFYLRRDFDIPRRTPGQCLWPVGAPQNVWEGAPHEIIVDAKAPVALRV